MLIVVFEDAVDRGLEIGDRSKTPRFSRRVVRVENKPSMLKKLSGLGIGLPTKIETDDFWLL